MNTFVIGYHQTQFGELWNKSLFDLAQEAVHGVLKKTQLEHSQIDAIFFANMLGGVLENNLHGGSKIAEFLHVHIPVYRIESACASGGAAFQLAHTYLQSGSKKTVLVVGAEKMTDVSPEEISEALISAASGEEQESGLTFPGLYAMMARAYMDEYGYTHKHLAPVSVKNHKHAALNPNAQFHREITEQDVLNSAMIADPLHILDCSPITDGAAAVVVSNDSNVVKKNKSAHILSSHVASDTISLLNRSSLSSIKATQIAAENAFSEAKLQRKDISVSEVHDCFSIAEILAMEDLGFWKKGEGGKRISQYETMIGSGGNLVVNTSGGLKAAGHPIGATGIKQIGELYEQLTHQADNRQILHAKYGLAHNVGGSGGTAVVTILGN